VSFATMALLLLVGGSVGTTLGMLDARRERAVAVDARLLAEAAGQATEAQRIEADAQRAEAVTQRREAVAQRERAEDNLALATAEGARARAVTDFLLETLGLADPDVTKLPEMSMADALDAAAAQVGEAFADYPENEAEIRRVIGTAYDTLGRPDLALPQLRRALHLYRNVLRSERTELADTMSVLYQVGQRVGEVDWVSIARNTLELRLSILAETDPDLARRFGLLTVDAKDPFVLPSLVRKAWGELCALARERIRPSDGAWPNVRILMYAVPLTMGWRSLTTDAPEMMEELLAQGLTVTSHRRVRYVTKMALYFRIRAGDYAGAKALASERVARLTEILGPDHWYLETYRSVIGECLAAEGRHDEAQAILERSLAVLERPGAQVFEDAVETRLRLAKLHEASGHPERAAPHRQALVDYALGLPFSIQWTMLRDYLGPEYTEVVEAIDEFDALVLQCAGSDEPLRSRAGELTAIIQRILETRRRLCPDGGSVALLVAGHMVERAENLLSASGLEEAREALLVEAMRLVRLHRDERPLQHVIGAAILFSHLIDLGDEERVRAVCLELDALVPEVLQEPGKVNFGALNSNSLTWYLVKSPGLAQETYAVIARFAALVLLAAPDRAEYSNTIGVALYRAGRYEEAIGHLAESDRLLRLDPERGGPVGSPADQAFLAMAHHRLGHGAEAAEAMERLGRLMQETSAALRPENQAFLAEAEAVLAD